MNVHIGTWIDHLSFTTGNTLNQDNIYYQEFDDFKYTSAVSTSNTLNSFETTNLQDFRTYAVAQPPSWAKVGEPVSILV